MKIFHTADWHLGKLVHGVYMTEDQRHVLNAFMEDVERDKPDAIIIAGDLYDRAVPPTEAVELLDELLERMVTDLKVPVLAIAGNHDSPARLDFASGIMRKTGVHLAGTFRVPHEPVKLCDEHGEVHIHLVPYMEPGKVRYLLGDPDIRTHDQAMQAIIHHIMSKLDRKARHILVAHAFVTPHGESAPGTSDVERPLSIGTAEYVSATHFQDFHYTALGHLHQAHYVGAAHIRYAGSPLKYSISEEHHRKGYLAVELDANGQVHVEQRELIPIRDMRTIEGKLADLEQQEKNDDYVFVQLLDETPVHYPMERLRTVFPNAMHVKRKMQDVRMEHTDDDLCDNERRANMDPLSLFKSFYREIKGVDVKPHTEKLFQDVLKTVLEGEGERNETHQADHDRIRTVQS